MEFCTIVGVEQAPEVVLAPKVEQAPLCNSVCQMNLLEFGASTTCGVIPVD